jgi:hypothetical protein
LKAVFKNKIFHYLLVAFISILLIWNAFIGISTSNIWAFVPIFIQVVLLALIFTRSRYTRIAIIWWSIIFLIATPCVELLARILDAGNAILDNGYIGTGIYSIVYSIGTLIIGILILDFTKRTVIVESSINQI